MKCQLSFRLLPVLRLFACGLLLSASTAGAAPSIVSTTPLNNATGVSIQSSLVVVFSEAMIPIEPAYSIPPFFVGNLEITPSEVANLLDFEWSADAKTLTGTPSGNLPVNTRITWEFNPAGTLLRFTSITGSALPTTSGVFTTGATGGTVDPGSVPPKLISTNPIIGATGVSVNSTVVFVFDQAMTPITALGGSPPFLKGPVVWSGLGLDGTKFSYVWSSDSKTVTCTYSSGLPSNSTITWTLNPADAGFRLENTNSQAVDMATGSFTTGAGSTTPDCDPDNTNPGWGQYTLSKSGEYTQSSSADPVPAADDPFNFGALVSSPDAGPLVTGASLTLPDGTRKTLQTLPGGGFYYLLDSPASAAAMDVAYPAGAYTFRIQQSGQSERVISMNMPATSPPVPKVTNYPEAQAVNPAADFTLRWNGFTGAGPSDSLMLSITEGKNTVFQAPDPCVPRQLAATATAIVIPASTLKAGISYNCRLSFTRTFYSSTNDLPKMAGFGSLMRDTTFVLTTTGGAPVDSPRFLTWGLSLNGRPLLTLSGSPGRQYTIQRSPLNVASPSWAAVGSVIPTSEGVATFADTQTGVSFPFYYRAVSP